MKPSSLFLIGIFLTGILLMGCQERGESNIGLKALENNPLALEIIADKQIDYVTSLQISANENNEPITDPAMLRLIDEIFIDSRGLQKKSHEMQDEGKMSSFYGINNNFAAGEVLLHNGWLHFGYGFEVDVAPGMKVYLAQHVSPHLSEELFSQPTMDLGLLKNIYGVQSYYVGKLSEDDWNKYRTVAIYSESMDKVIALAQIRRASNFGE